MATTRCAPRSFSTLVASACDDDAKGTDDDRHPVGKADLVGECTPDDCDGPSSGNCWCDAGCLEFQDCCANVYAVCEGLPEPECDDDSALNQLCDIKPTCEPGQVAARQNGCFHCVDALTCEAPPASCDDGSMLNQLCDVPPVCEAGTEKALQNGCFVCVDPATCEPPAPSCDDGSTLNQLCDVPPICEAGTVKALQNSCFVCVDPATCEPV